MIQRHDPNVKQKIVFIDYRTTYNLGITVNRVIQRCFVSSQKCKYRNEFDRVMMCCYGCMKLSPEGILVLEGSNFVVSAYK